MEKKKQTTIDYFQFRFEKVSIYVFVYVILYYLHDNLYIFCFECVSKQSHVPWTLCLNSCLRRDTTLFVNSNDIYFHSEIDSLRRSHTSCGFV